MNPSIKKLSEIAGKETRRIIGLMSGTSLDGLDIALCKISGSGTDTKAETEHFLTMDYDEESAAGLKKISSVEQVSLSEICYRHTWLADLHAKMILKALDEWNLTTDDVDCIASHGQTIYHLPARDQKNNEPRLNSTLQIADGDHIAVKTGILTISDLRQKHTAAGGEGAPLAGLVDELLFASDEESRILLNIGGIGNFTWLPAKSTNQNSFTTDTGPGNTLIDKLMQHYFDEPFDWDGMTARSGSVHEPLLNALQSDPWFDGEGSKTTGPEYFSTEWLRSAALESGIDTGDIPPEDLIRTVTELSARTISSLIRKSVPENEKPVIYTSGGGVHNPVMMEQIAAGLPDYPMKDFAELGMNPDAKEAVIFAVLANEMLAGHGFSIDTPKGRKRVQLGKISFPSK
jgi:anhydro-N-acetylmuramic acid kinase